MIQRILAANARRHGPARALRGAALLAAVPFLCCSADTATPGGGAPGCGDAACACGPILGAGFIQRRSRDAQGDFDVVVPHAGGGLAHYRRDNGSADWSFPWHGPEVFGSGDVGGVALIQSDSGQGNLEVVATVAGQLVHHFRRGTGAGPWSHATVIAGGVRGQPGFVQSQRGARRGFEVVVPLAAGGLAHLSRDNDATWLPWSAPVVLGAGRVYDAVALFQSRRGAARLEVVARSGSDLWALHRDGGGPGRWSSPTLVAVGGTPVQAAGTHGLIQRGQGSEGDLELVVPLASGGLAHYARDSDAAGSPWRGPTIIDDGGSYTAAAVIQGDYSEGNLEVVARKDGVLVAASRDSLLSFRWREPRAVGAEPCCDPVAEGAWADPIESGMVGIHATLLPTGKILFFGFEDEDDRAGQSEIMDPSTGAIERTEHAPLSSHPNLFCSGHTLLPDGRLWVTGGHHMDLTGSHTLDPSTGAWTAHAPMPVARWYPTAALLPDGTALTISGTTTGEAHDDDPDQINNSWEVFDPTTNTLSALHTSMPSPFSTDGFAAVDLYPFVYALPSGKVMVHSRQTTRFLDVAKASWDPVAYTTRYPSSRTFPAQGTSVLLTLSPDDGYTPRVLVIGGAGPSTAPSTPATSTVEVLDLGAASPEWRYVASMSHPRVQPDSVLLPDGRVLVIGGSSSGKTGNSAAPVLTPEVYDPKADRWTALCPMRVPRLYHATALLLPDARVLVAGRDGQYNVSPYQWPEHRVEIFSPPYLAAGPRPVLEEAPLALSHGALFQVGVSGVPAERVARAVLISLGSVTHSFNMNQRAIELRIADASPGALSLQAPPGPGVAPPGHYMLFLVSDLGAPSVAALVKL